MLRSLKLMWPKRSTSENKWQLTRLVFQKNPSFLKVTFITESNTRGVSCGMEIQSLDVGDESEQRGWIQSIFSVSGCDVLKWWSSGASQLVRAIKASTTFPMCSRKLRSATPRGISISPICEQHLVNHFAPFYNIYFILYRTCIHTCSLISLQVYIVIV